MKTFKIEIIETLSKIVEVEAENKQEALDKAIELYYDGDDNFVLDYDDRIDSEISLYEEE